MPATAHQTFEFLSCSDPQTRNAIGDQDALSRDLLVTDSQLGDKVELYVDNATVKRTLCFTTVR